MCAVSYGQQAIASAYASWIGEEDAARPNARRACLLNHVNDPDPCSSKMEDAARAGVAWIHGPVGTIPVNERVGGAWQPSASSK